MARLKQVTESELETQSQQYLHDPLVTEDTTLIRTAFDNPFIQLLWRQHYVGSKGTVGRQIHYIIYHKKKAVGAISAGSAMFANKKRDEFLGVTQEEKKKGVRHIINNTMFRLIRPKDDEPKASSILKLFREVVTLDWLKDYGDHVRAFETLVEPPRWGGIYKIDGWKKLGMTAGLGARRPLGHGTMGKNSTGVRKIIKVPKKIIWVMPLFSYQDALLKSALSTKDSYGDDAVKISNYLKTRLGHLNSATTISQMTSISYERVKTLLYLMSLGDSTIKRDGDGNFQFVGDNSAEATPHIYSRETQQPLAL
jgi:hypothetical protein